MEHPVQVTFRGLEPTDAIREAVEERARKLERFFEKIESCRIVIESPHQRQQKGRLYHVRIQINVPGEELVVSRDPAQHAPHSDLYYAINDAFKEATRQLEDYVRRRRGLTKKREGAEEGKVSRLFPEEGYGFLSTPDGREVYFHENAVLDGGFSRLSVGTVVRFAEEQGEKGPQASTVAIRG